MKIEILKILQPFFYPQALALHIVIKRFEEESVHVEDQIVY